MSNFRKIDIDAIEDEYLTENDLLEIDHRDESSAVSIFTQLQSQVRQLINGWSILATYLYFKLMKYFSGDTVNALILTLDDPPYGPTVEQAKVSFSLCI